MNIGDRIEVLTDALDYLAPDEGYINHGGYGDPDPDLQPNRAKRIADGIRQMLEQMGSCPHGWTPPADCSKCPEVA